MLLQPAEHVALTAVWAAQPGMIMSHSCTRVSFLHQPLLQLAKSCGVIDSSPEIQETTWLLCSGLQQVVLYQAPVWQHLSSFLLCLSWRTAHSLHCNFSENVADSSLSEMQVYVSVHTAFSFTLHQSLSSALSLTLAELGVPLCCSVLVQKAGVC